MLYQIIYCKNETFNLFCFSFTKRFKCNVSRVLLIGLIIFNLGIIYHFILIIVHGSIISKGLLLRKIKHNWSWLVRDKNGYDQKDCYKDNGLQGIRREGQFVIPICLWQQKINGQLFFAQPAFLSFFSQLIFKIKCAKFPGIVLLRFRGGVADMYDERNFGLVKECRL